MAGTVAAYYSVGTEPDTHGLLFALWKRGAYVLLPLLLPDGDLDWASTRGRTRSGRPGAADGAGRAAAWRGRRVQRGPGAVPALAADHSGLRLGRGGGSYDRALARVGAQVPTVALLYDAELVPVVPGEPHDQRVRMVARPSAGVTTLPLHG